MEGRIVIGCGELAAVQILPKMIQTFNQKYPLVTYDIFTANADLVKEQMEKGLIDIGVLLEPIDIEKFDFIRLTKKRAVDCLMQPDDPLTEKDTITAKDLEGLPLILPRRQNVQNEVANWFGDSFQKVQILFTSNFNTNSAIMVQGGLGYSLVIEGAVPFWDKEKMTYRDFSLLNTGEFLNREMNLCEIKNHLLCKWSSRRLIALEKPPML